MPAFYRLLIRTCIVANNLANFHSHPITAYTDLKTNEIQLLSNFLQYHFLETLGSSALLAVAFQVKWASENLASIT